MADLPVLLRSQEQREWLLEATVALLAPLHAGHVQAELAKTRDAVDMLCSCGARLSIEGKSVAAGVVEL